MQQSGAQKLATSRIRVARHSGAQQLARQLHLARQQLARQLLLDLATQQLARQVHLARADALLLQKRCSPSKNPSAALASKTGRPHCKTDRVLAPARSLSRQCSGPLFLLALACLAERFWTKLFNGLSFNSFCPNRPLRHMKT